MREFIFSLVFGNWFILSQLYFILCSFLSSFTHRLLFLFLFICVLHLETYIRNGRCQSLCEVNDWIKCISNFFNLLLDRLNLIYICLVCGIFFWNRNIFHFKNKNKTTMVYAWMYIYIYVYNLLSSSSSSFLGTNASINPNKT